MNDRSAISGKPSNGDEALALLGSELAGRDGVELEFSLRLRTGAVETRGRFCAWLAGTDAAAFEPMARLLERCDAPTPVRDAQARLAGYVRQGLAIAAAHDGLEFRLYLHGRPTATMADRYRAWRWRPGAEPRRATYSFYYLPETPSGRRPLELVDERLRPAFSSLLAEERLLQSSGFWLRKTEDGKVDQLDLTFPWYPEAGTLRGLVELAGILELPPDEPSPWRRLAIRHVAVHVGRASPAVTLYSSAPLRGPWPAGEEALQEDVRRGARATRQAIERQVYRRLPSLPPAGGTNELDSFYGGEVATWRSVLGPELHYHAGLFDATAPTADDAAMDAALRRAVTELYPFIPASGRIYDIGCGWGGPLTMWIRDLGCRALGLTVSGSQFRHVAALGLPVRWGDAERTLPPGRFDCVILLESLSHVGDKARLLQVLRLFADRLVMRVNCQDGSPASPAFGGSMQVISSARLRDLLTATGWRVRHWRDRRREALPSVAVWHRRLRDVPASADRHLETLRAWCARVMRAPQEWGRHNPLIEVVAD